MAITQTTDFVGEVNISQNRFSDGDLNNFIQLTEEKILKELLGDDLYLKFEADNFGMGAMAREQDKELLNGLVYPDPLNGFNVDYIGIKRMLRLFCYYEFIKEQKYQNTIIGTVEGSSRNAINSAQGVVIEVAEERQRQGVDLYDKAQKFIHDNNKKSYPTTSIVDQGGNVYLVSLSTTKYILDGDEVTINAKKYTVSNLIDDTSFEISETSGTIFVSNSRVEFELFPTFNGIEKKKQYLGGLF